MKNALLKLAIIGILSTSGYVQAGWVSLPETGFAESAYTNCYNAGRDETPGPAGDGVGGAANDRKGNFGSYPIYSSYYPSSGINDTCWVPFSGTEAVLPAGKTGFTATASSVRAIPNPTGGTSIGEVYDRYWRNPTTNTCIIATRVRTFNVDSDAATGTQYFEVNDIVRGGFSDSAAVSIAYSISISPVTNVHPVFRVGRTFTSVQHRSYKYDNLVNKSLNGLNYLDLPTKNSVTAAISGEASPVFATSLASTTLSTQDAAVNPNYIDFTVRTVYIEGDLSAKTYSPITYIEAICSANPTTQPGAIRLRQTAQKFNAQKIIDMDGYSIGVP